MAWNLTTNDNGTVIFASCTECGLQIEARTYEEISFAIERHECPEENQKMKLALDILEGVR